MSIANSDIKDIFTISQDVNPVITGVFPVNFRLFTIDDEGLENIKVEHLGQGYLVKLGVVGAWKTRGLR